MKNYIQDIEAGKRSPTVEILDRLAIALEINFHSLSEIFQTAHQGLRKEVKLLSPRKVYQASNAMNAAFAEFIDDLLGRHEYFKPYQGTEFEAIGHELRSMNHTDRGHPGDKETTDQWVEKLDLAGWYTWQKV